MSDGNKDDGKDDDSGDKDDEDRKRDLNFLHVVLNQPDTKDCALK